MTRENEKIYLSKSIKYLLFWCTKIMAIDNLNYYSAWLPAGQQTDRYSSQPWCLRSKNLDIFSSSKSVKATAFTAPTTVAQDIVKSDWWLVLKTDEKVYDSEWTLVTNPNTNFPVYKVCYTGWKNGTYGNATFGGATTMSVKPKWTDWDSLIVYTDRASYLESKVKFTATEKTFFTWDADDWMSPLTPVNTSTTKHGYSFELRDKTKQSATLYFKVGNWHFASFPIRVFADDDGSTSSISLNNISYKKPSWYYYDAEMDAMLCKWLANTWTAVTTTWDLKNWWVVATLPLFPTWWAEDESYMYKIDFTFTSSGSYSWAYWRLYVDINWWPDVEWKMTIDGQESDWDYNYYYSYLPLLAERDLNPVWEYYWMKWKTFQPLYHWEASWVDINGEKKAIYDFVQYMWWINEPDMDVIGMITRNEQVYMIWNLKWNWYIIPCDLSWGRWTPYIAYGCTFLWATNIDYLLYLVWEDRWISTLWVYNQQELVQVIWGNKETMTNDLVWVDEQYNFDWKIVNRRKNLILTTKDKRIFQYGQTYGGKGWSFIHELPYWFGILTIIYELATNGKDLDIVYSVKQAWVTTKYKITYQDDIAKKNYNTQWEAVYPIVLWNHLLEKEESDLYTSFILPSASTKLEFWGMANHYHFWTFTSTDNVTLSETESYKIKWTSWTYALKFIERNGEQYTFRLEWDLPVMDTGESK